MDIERWEIVNNNHKRWKHNLYWGLEQREQKRRLSAGKKHSRQKENHEGTSAGGASLYAFIVVKTVTPADGDEASVVAVQAMVDAALPSANEA